MATPVIPAGLDGFITADSITQVDRLKLALLGEPGSGKSWCAVTGRKPMLVYDFDDRKESIAGRKDVYIKTVVDPEQGSPKAWAEFEKDLGMFEYLKTKNQLQIKTIVCDSITFMLKAAHNQLMKDNEGLCRKIRVNGIYHLIPQGWDSINVSQRMLEAVFNRLFELGIDIIVCAHIRREKDASSTEKNPVFTGKWTIEPQNLKMLLPKFNERWLITNEYGEFKAVTKPNMEFNGVTALNIDGVESPNIEEILRKHGENTRKQPR